MKGFPNIKKELKNMQNMLSNKPDENLIEGYKKAMKEYKQTGEIQHKHAAMFIKKELDNRGVEVDEEF